MLSLPLGDLYCSLLPLPLYLPLLLPTTLRPTSSSFLHSCFLKAIKSCRTETCLMLISPNVQKHGNLTVSLRTRVAEKKLWEKLVRDLLV